MKFIIIVVVLIGLYLVFKYLLAQSKKPTGVVGSLMMRLWNRVYLPMAEWCLSYLDKKSYSSVLDVGIGNGATTNYISNHFVCKSIIGIDLSEIAIKQANSKNLNSNIKFEEKDIQKTEYPSNSFDLICAFQNHFHWENIGKSFLEIKRILSINGVLLIGCEYSKIKYYLPSLKVEEDFRKYLNNLDLELIQTKRKRDWVMYQITKRKE